MMWALVITLLVGMGALLWWGASIPSNPLRDRACVRGSHGYDSDLPPSPMRQR